MPPLNDCCPILATQKALSGLWMQNLSHHTRFGQSGQNRASCGLEAILKKWFIWPCFQVDETSIFGFPINHQWSQRCHKTILSLSPSKSISSTEASTSESVYLAVRLANVANLTLTTTPANLAVKAKFRVQTIFSRWD